MATQQAAPHLATFLHEVRLPLHVIAGFGEVIREAGDAQTREDALQRLLEQAAHLQQMVDDYGEWCRLEQAGQPPETTESSPFPVLREVLGEAEQRCRVRGLRLEVGWGSFVPERVHCVPRVLQRALRAAVDHVLRCARGGAVEVRISYRDCDDGPLRAGFAVRVGAAEASPAPRTLDLAPFAVRDPAGRPDLGLSIAHEHLGRLGGSLQPAHDSRGLWFVLRLPAAPVAGCSWLDPMRTAGEARDGGRLPAGCRVLVVDDARDNQCLLRHVLTKAGARVEVADRGDLAVQQVLAARSRGEPFAAVLMDVMMPVLDGPEAVRILRRQGYAGSIVAITARSQASDENLCLTAGCDAFLPKPVRADQLLRTLAALVQDPAAAPAAPTTPLSGR